MRQRSIIKMDQMINNYLKHTCSIHCAYKLSHKFMLLVNFFLSLNSISFCFWVCMELCTNILNKIQLYIIQFVISPVSMQSFFTCLLVFVSVVFFFSVPLTTDLVTSSAFGKQPHFYCFHEFHFEVAFRQFVCKTFIIIYSQ